MVPRSPRPHRQGTLGTLQWGCAVHAPSCEVSEANEGPGESSRSLLMTPWLSSVWNSNLISAAHLQVFAEQLVTLVITPELFRILFLSLACKIERERSACCIIIHLN